MDSLQIKNGELSVVKKDVSATMTRVNRAEEKAYDYIKNQIVTGSWPPLTKIIEQDISDFLKISRSPVRGAIKRLSDEGLLDAEPYKGAVVARRKLTQQEFVDRMEMLEMLLQQYLFLLEKRHLPLDWTNLFEKIEQINEAITSQASTSSIAYMGSQFLEMLLKEQPNKYICKTIISIGEDILDLNLSRTNKKIYSLYQLFINGLKKMIAYMEKNDYVNARKEVRIFVNRLMLQVIDEQLVS